MDFTHSSASSGDIRRHIHHDLAEVRRNRGILPSVGRSLSTMASDHPVNAGIMVQHRCVYSETEETDVRGYDTQMAFSGDNRSAQYQLRYLSSACIPL